MNTPPPSPKPSPRCEQATSSTTDTGSSSKSSSTTSKGSKTTGKAKGSSFRLRGKNLFLTYPKCDLLPDLALSFLQTVVSLNGMKSYIVAQESHKDGSSHLHCFLVLEEPFDSTSPRCLDLPGENGAVFHGNYRIARDQGKVAKYCTKEGNYLTNLTPGELTKLQAKTATRKKNEYMRAREMMSLGATIAEAVQVIALTPRGARDLTLQGPAITRSLSSLRARKMVLQYHLSDFPGWRIERDPNTTLILSGPPNTGKTQLAKALNPDALFVTHLDQLREFNPENSTGIIFDEGSFRHMHREAQIHLTDVLEDRTVHCRYAVAFLPAGTSRTIVTNLHPDQVLFWDDYAIRRRCQYVEVRALNDYHNYGTPQSETEHNAKKCEKKFTLVV